MAIYETIPTTRLAKQNEIIETTHLPELVNLDDSAKSVFIDFSKHKAATVPPQMPIDVALHEMKSRHIQMLLVIEEGQVIGLISQEDLMSERPLLLMQEKSLRRSEVAVDSLMKPRRDILTIETVNLKNAKVGHIINTIKENNAPYILVVKKLSAGKQQILGLFSAIQIGRQLHWDLSSTLTKTPQTIIELHKQRRK